MSVIGDGQTLRANCLDGGKRGAGIVRWIHGHNPVSAAGSLFLPTQAGRIFGPLVNLRIGQGA